MCIGECNQEGSSDSRGGRWGIKPVSEVAMERERDGDTAAAAAKSLQSCLTLCDPVDSSSPGSPIPGILQARVLEWVAIVFSEMGMLEALQKAGRLPWWLSGKEPACNSGDAGSTRGSGRSPGERNGNPLLYSCLGNPMDRGAWWGTVHGVARELDTT